MQDGSDSRLVKHDGGVGDSTLLMKLLFKLRTLKKKRRMELLVTLTDIVRGSQ